jgi:PKD repeat protein
MLYQISSGVFFVIAEADIIQEARICGTKVVWRQGGADTTQVILYDLTWLGTSHRPEIIAGPVPTNYAVDIGERFVVWAECVGEQYDIFAYDLAASTSIQVTDTNNTLDNEPSTSGPWIVWQAQDKGSYTRIIMRNMDSNEERIVVDNTIKCRPRIDSDLVTWESLINGNFDIFVYRISTGETFYVKHDSFTQYLNDVFGNNVAYVDQRTGSEDIYVSHLEFVPASGNHFPVAEAGPDQNMYSGDTVYLHGSAYDPDGDPIILWSWVVVESPTGSQWYLDDSDNPTAQFQTYSAGDYVLALAVLDDHYNGSAPDYVNVHVHDNQPPVAIATADVNSGVVPLTVCFDGTQSYDPEGGPLTYFWDLGDGPGFAETPTVCHTYQSTGQYTVGFTVMDERNASDTEILIITVNPPHIQAYEQTVWCDGSSAVGGQLNATDQNGHQMTFALDTTPENGTADIEPNGVFVYTPNAWDGNDKFGFTASDGNYISNEAFVNLYVFNRPLEADAGRDRYAYIGHTVTLQGSAFDPDGDEFEIILWSWIVESAPEGSSPYISDTYIQEPNFSGDIAGDYILALAVVDANYNCSTPDRILIRVVDVNCRIGDLTGNCRVDIEDLDMFCEQWLKDVDCFGQAGCADLIRDYYVDFDDFAELGRDWGI